MVNPSPQNNQNGATPSPAAQAAPAPSPSAFSALLNNQFTNSAPAANVNNFEPMATSQGPNAADRREQQSMRERGQTVQYTHDIFAGTRIKIEYYNGADGNLHGSVTFETYSKRHLNDNNAAINGSPDRVMVFDIANNDLSREERFEILKALRQRLSTGTGGDAAVQAFVRSKQFAVSLLAPTISAGGHKEGLMFLDQPSVYYVDPETGRLPINPNTGRVELDPNTGKPPYFNNFELHKAALEIQERHNRENPNNKMQITFGDDEYGVGPNEGVDLGLLRNLANRNIALKGLEADTMQGQLEELTHKIKNGIATFYGGYKVGFTIDCDDGLFKEGLLIRDDDGYYLHFTPRDGIRDGVIDRPVDTMPIFGEGTDHFAVLRIWLGDHRGSHSKVLNAFKDYMDEFRNEFKLVKQVDADGISSGMVEPGQKLFATSRLVAKFLHHIDEDRDKTSGRIPGEIGGMAIYNADLYGIIWPRFNADGMSINNCRIHGNAFLGVYGTNSRWINVDVPRNAKIIFVGSQGGNVNKTASNLDIIGGYWGCARPRNPISWFFKAIGIKMPFSRPTVEIAGGIEGGKFRPKRFWCNCADMHTFKPNFELLKESSIYRVMKYCTLSTTAVTGTVMAKWIVKPAWLPFVNIDESIAEWWYKSKMASMEDIYNYILKAQELHPDLKQIVTRSNRREFVPGGTRRKAPFRVGLVTKNNAQTIELASYGDQYATPVTDLVNRVLSKIPRLRLEGEKASPGPKPFEREKDPNYDGDPNRPYPEDNAPELSLEARKEERLKRYGIHAICSFADSLFKPFYVRPGFANTITRTFVQNPVELPYRHSPLALLAEVLPELGSVHYVNQPMEEPPPYDGDLANASLPNGR